MGIHEDLTNVITQRSPKSLVLHLAIFATLISATSQSDSEQHWMQSESPISAGLPHCVEQLDRRIGRRLLYITTLDGRLSALDIANSGKVQWSVTTGPGPLISSSIHRLELTNNGQFVRMIPSLSGGIYKFDGSSIDPIPITAEHLLSSSSKFSDDLVISGGKETRTYGVSVRTGQLLYECSINGCVNATDGGNAIRDPIEQDATQNGKLRDDDGYLIKHDPLLDDVLVLRRQTQTVRAVESRTGLERWNFSVGQHDLDFLPASECHNQPRSEMELAVLDVDIKVVVPQGVICAFSKSEPHVMLWKYQFDHPIVSAWFTNAADKLQPIDLFNSAQWLWEQDDEKLFEVPQQGESPSIYLGMYERQLYIQESVQLRRQIVDQIELYQQMTGEVDHMPKIPWRPLAAGKNSLVMFSNNHNNVVGESTSESTPENHELVPYNENVAVAAQSVLNGSEFVNGNGFFFYTDSQWNNPNGGALECGKNQTPNDLPAIEDSSHQTGDGENTDPNNLSGGANTSNNHSMNDHLGFSLDDIDAPVKVVILSLWFWWKEIVVIAFTSAVILNLFMGQRAQRVEREYLVIERHVPVQTAIEATEASTQALLGPVVPAVAQSKINGNRFNFNEKCLQRSISETTTHSGEQYISRFQSDFDLMQCLGRGGFGVVFEAKNKLDENKYAIKRITLPNKETSRQRVLREARTLASCEHQNIVRYFHSWVETPPVGWQEEEDRKLLAHEMSTSIQIETPDGSTFPSLVDSLARHKDDKLHKHQQDKRHQLLSWVSDAVNSTACSHDFGHTESSLNRIREDDEDDDDSCIVFRSESQSAALRDQDDDDDSDSETDCNSNGKTDKSEALLQKQPDSVSIDIHSASFDLKNINYSQHHLSNSFQIESVRSKSDAGDGDDDLPSCGTPKRKSLTLALMNNNNALQGQTQPTPPPTASIQNGIMKPSKVYLYIQMQLCRKESLRDWLRDNRLEERAAHIAHIFHQIVDAVDYVHLKGLIHRDLKPSNIFFSQDGQIKIGDFGLVTDMSDIPNLVTQCGDHTGLPSCARHTQQVGTHLYMSPEQLRGHHYDYKVDIYSLGLIFFELHVYFGTEMERIKTLRELRDGKYPHVFDTNYPAECALLKQMLATQPTQRPKTMELKQQLHQILQLPEHVADGRTEQAVMAAAARRLSRSRTFSSSE